MVWLGIAIWEQEYVSLPRRMDTLTRELLVQIVGHYVARPALEAGVAAVDLLYDTQAAEHVKHLVHQVVVDALDLRVLVQSVGESVVTRLWPREPSCSG